MFCSKHGTALEEIEVRYTEFLYVIGILGACLGTVICGSMLYLPEAVTRPQMGVFGGLMLAISLVFILVKNRIVYLMFTGMWAIFCVLRTLYPVGVSGYPNLLFALAFWICLAYLIAKYFSIWR